MCEETWAPKNRCFWTVLLEKTLLSPLDCKEIQPVRSKGDQPWVFFGRNDAKAETPVLWPPHANSWLIGKDSDAGRDWGQEEKGTTEDEMAGWHHWLDVCEFEWTLGDGDGQGGLACCDSWGRSDTRVRHDWATELNWTELKHSQYLFFQPIAASVLISCFWYWWFFFLSRLARYSVQLSCSIMSNSLRSHGLQHPGLPVHHQLPKFTQTHVHWVCDATQPSHPLSSPSPTFNLSRHQGLFKWVSSSHQVAKVLEIQLQHQSFQWIFRTDFL